MLATTLLIRVVRNIDFWRGNYCDKDMPRYDLSIAIFDTIRYIVPPLNSNSVCKIRILFEFRLSFWYYFATLCTALANITNTLYVLFLLKYVRMMDCRTVKAIFDHRLHPSIIDNRFFFDRVSNNR